MEGLSKSTTPLSHFRLKIDSFSSLLTSSVERFESCQFDGGDYKWKLALYPNGNKERGGKDHISLYLVLADSSCFDVNKEILVSFSLFLFDHSRDKYFSAQGISRFCAIKSESGFDKFLSLKIFNDPSNGYRVDDTSMFGAEMFFIESTTKKQCLSMNNMKNEPFKYTWKIEKFAELKDESYYSEPFTIDGHDFKILVYPKGNGDSKGKNLSLYLALADPDKVSPTVKVSLRVIDQVNKKHCEKKITENICLSASRPDWGFTSFMLLNDLKKSPNGYLINDTCILEAEVTFPGSDKDGK